MDAPHPPYRFGRPEDLTKRESLERILGPLSKFSVKPFPATGFSGCTHKAVRAVTSDGTVKRFVAKRIPLQSDWTNRLSDSIRSREAGILATPALGNIWKVYRSPYVAFSETANEGAVLMEDLTPHFLPDVKEPLKESQEELIVTTLARLHAMYWNSPLLQLPWLATFSSFWSILGPERVKQRVAAKVLPPKMFHTLVRGWRTALRLLPSRAVKILSVGKQEAAEQWAHLPSTLLHGDAKIANFAILDEGKVAAFDWALAGKGPAAVDLGWYIAINATRLTASKQEFLEGYRQALEQELVVSLDGKQWQEIVTASILIGARMFLWSKAAALDSDTPAARREWKWWVSRLEEFC